MKRRLLILGAGGFGRQLEQYIDSAKKPDVDWSLEGYIDDDIDALKGKESDYKILGDVNSFSFRSSDLILIAIADIETKRKIVDKLKSKVEFFTFIAEDASIGKNVKIGKGAVICPGVHIGSNVTIGDFCLINLNTIIGHDSQLQDFCSIMPRVDVGGGSHIGSNVYMGTKATISPMLRICNDAHIGVGAVVIKNIIEPGTYFGNPARKMLN